MRGMLDEKYLHVGDEGWKAVKRENLGYCCESLAKAIDLGSIVPAVVYTKRLALDDIQLQRKPTK